MKYDTFDSNDMLETKLLAGRTGYDVVVPTAYFLARQIKAGVFQKLDKSKLPNLSNAWDEIARGLAAYDPGIVWVNDPGAGPWAGRFEGIEAVARMFGEYLDFLEGTFTMEVLDVCASPDRTTSFLVERATKAGRPYENRAVWITRWQGDVVVEVITVDLDRDDALEFWRSVTA